MVQNLERFDLLSAEICHDKGVVRRGEPVRLDFHQIILPRDECGLRYGKCELLYGEGVVCSGKGVGHSGEGVVRSGKLVTCFSSIPFLLYFFHFFVTFLGFHSKYAKHN